MKIYVVGNSTNRYFTFDESREKFLIDTPHDGDNIDNRNSRYCELTGLYYLWKHCNDDIVGLEHYRRYFSYKDHLLNENDAKELLNEYQVIYHKAQPIRYRLGRQCISFCGQKDFDKVMLSLKTVYPEYYKTAQEVVNLNYHIQYNMMICKKEFLDAYCEWLFDILNPIVDFTGLDKFKRRSIGYSAEILLSTVYMVHNNIKGFNCDVKLNGNKHGQGFSKFGTPLSFNIRK